MTHVFTIFAHAIWHAFSMIKKHFILISVSTVLLVGIVVLSVALWSNVLFLFAYALPKAPSFNLTMEQGAILVDVILVLGGLFLSSGFIVGYYKIMLDLKDKGSSKINVLWHYLSYALSLFFGYLVIIGMYFLFAFLIKKINIYFEPTNILRYVPRIIIAAINFIIAHRLLFFPYFMVDKKIGVFKALYLSWQRTQKKLSLVIVWCSFVAAVWALFLVIPKGALIFMIPGLGLVQSYLYRYLEPKN